MYNTIQFNSGVPLGGSIGGELVDWMPLELPPNTELLWVLLFGQQFVWKATKQIDIDRLEIFHCFSRMLLNLNFELIRI